jgi:probable HAF family extracellular repeat protein
LFAAQRAYILHAAVSSSRLYVRIGAGVAALASGLLIAAAPAAPAAVITPISQDRSAKTEVQHRIVQCDTTICPPSECCTLAVLTDETLSDVQAAGDFGPFSATAFVANAGVNPAVQQSAISGGSLSAWSSVYALGSGIRTLIWPLEIREETFDPRSESRYSVTFSLDEASPFYLDGGLFVSGDDFYVKPSEAQATATLTGPGGPVVDVEIAFDTSDVITEIHETGNLDPGVYTLETVVWAQGYSFFWTGEFDEEQLGVAAESEFSVTLALEPPRPRASFAVANDASPPTSDPTSAEGVSDDGSVVVGQVGFPGGSWEAFRWAGGSRTGLGLLPGADNSWANAVSGDGLVVVGTSQCNSCEPYASEAFRWVGGAMAGLGDLPGGDSRSGATDVSADGSVVVGGGSSASGREAFRWAGGAMEGLGDLPGGDFYSAARGVSADGSVVVGEGSSASGSEAFRWAGGAMEGLGELPGGNFYSTAYGVSADGSTIVGVSVGSGGVEAVRWYGGELLGLGKLPGHIRSRATSASADGSRIAGYSEWTTISEGFVWDADNGMRSAKALLEGCGLHLVGWHLLDANISANGRVLYGTASDPNWNARGWVASLCSSEAVPASPLWTLGVLAGVLAALGALTLLTRRSRGLRPAPAADPARHPRPRLDRSGG